MDETNQIIFINLAEDVLKSGASFEGLTHGSFIDMHGRRARITKKDLEKMVKNTRELIATTETESGELVGLPVDAFGHDNGDGAGWIKDVNLSEDGEKILFSVDWTEIGYELISKKIRRWFSATIRLARKTIFGGTLTNWPAVRAPNGEYLLKPIELSNNLFQLSLDGATTLQEIRQVERAFYSEYGYDDYWITDIDLEDSAVIVSTNGEYYAVAFELSKDGISFSAEDDWQKVQRTWKVLSQTIDKVKNFIAPKPKPNKEKEKTEDLIMDDKTRQEITDMISAAVSDAVAPLAANFSSASPPPDGDGEVRQSLQEIINLEGMTEELNGEIQRVLEEEIVSVQRMAQADFAKKLAMTKRRAVATELCTNLTQGTPDVPRGLPLDAEELKNHLLELDPAQTTYFSGVLESIWRNGFLSYEELGHAQDVKGKRALPAEYAEDLRNGKMKLADLSDPILALGDLSEYDLSEFKE